MSEFSSLVIDWQKKHGRHDLPWQRTRDPYRVWLSEIMLQQTQVTTVIPYYLRFLERFPDVQALAAAPTEEVMALWSGLGYYARARNLHRAAQQIVLEHTGAFPKTVEALSDLPGIGRSTAAAIAVFAFGARAAILDGNVKRVLTRVFGIDGYPGERSVEQALWSLASELLPENDCEAYIQGQMDLGASICTRSKPRCDSCPINRQCIARRDHRVSELPTSRPRREVPERSVTALVLVKDECVLLERRPPVGIWGGLLSLPELPEADTLTAFAQHVLGCHVEVFQALETVRHTFTHFRLNLLPMYAVATPIQGVADTNRFVWVSINSLKDVPLPAPVRSFLGKLSGLMVPDRFAMFLE